MVTFDENAYCTAYGKGLGGSSILLTLTIFISIIGLITTSLISYHSLLQLPKLKKLHHQIKYLHISSLIASLILFIVSFLNGLFCVAFNLFFPSIIADAVFISVYCILILLLLAMLIFRLHSTFLNSIFILSKSNEWILRIAYILNVLFAILYIINYMVVTFVFHGNWNSEDRGYGYIFLGWCGPVALSIYSITSIYAIYLFLHKLMKLVKLHSRDNMELSQLQLNMLNKAVKYGALFSIAIFTSILTCIGLNLATFLWNTEKGDSWTEHNAFMNHLIIMIATIDGVVNVICQYLQFSFTGKYYDKCCKQWLEYGCRQMLTADAEKSIQFKAIKDAESDFETASVIV